MSKTCAFRRDISDACNWHQEQALTSTIYIIYQTGPTGFLLKEEGEAKNFKVFLGNPHNCTCSVFKKEKDLCKHICWILLKKFRVDRADSLSWQLGLNEREINQIIRGDTAQEQKNRLSRTTAAAKKQLNQTGATSATANGEVEQKAITESDVCPICQDELLVKKLPVTHCRFGCGNNVHIKCMKVWADHQKSNGETQLKCPLCRETFCSFELLEQEFKNNSLFKQEKLDLHYGIVCKSCRCTPIVGKCYKCTVCNELYLCQTCFNTRFHNNHSFVFREKVTQKFRQASRDHVGLIPSAVANELANRELSEQDYDLLLQLESANKNLLSHIPEKVIKSWPSEKIRENNLLLNPGHQCRICLRAFQVNQTIRKIPCCKHKFHLDCIDNWLLHSHPTCPVDGLVVWDPVTAQMEKEEKQLKKVQQSNSKTNVDNANQQPDKNAKMADLTLGMLINYKTFVPVARNPPINEAAKTDLAILNHNSTNNSRTSIKNRSASTSEQSIAGRKNAPGSGQRSINEVRIEVAGNGLMLNHQIFPATNNRLNKMPLPNIQPLNGTRFTRPAAKNLSQTSNARESVLFRRNTDYIINASPVDSALNVTSLIRARPYQLTRLQADFDDIDSDFDDDQSEKFEPASLNNVRVPSELKLQNSLIAPEVSRLTASAVSSYAIQPVDLNNQTTNISDQATLSLVDNT